MSEKILSIIIPAYNESTYIVRCLQNVIQTNLPGWKKEIIIIDDGSTDDTLSIVKQFSKETHKLTVLENVTNQGKGASVRNGIKASSGDIVIIQDADLEYDPSDYSSIINSFTDSSVMVVYGSRVEGAKIYHNYDANVFFLWGGLLLTKIVNMAFGTKITDQATCYKAWRGSLSKDLIEYCRSSGFEFEIEMTAFFAKKRMIYEVPIHYYPRSVAHGKKIRASDFFKSIYMIFLCASKK